jgi:tetratricopeptide (TPR) repeat protein
MQAILEDNEFMSDSVERKDNSSELHDEGVAAMKARDYDTAVKKLTGAADLSPHFKTYELLGECYLELKDFPRAIKYAAAAAGIGNNQFRSRFILAKALFEYGNVQWAVDKLNEALRMKPDYKSAKEMLERLREDEDELRKRTGNRIDWGDR